MEPTDTLQRIAAAGLPLGVRCRHCQHRRLVDAKALAARVGPKLVSGIRFRCSKCGGRNVAVEKFWSRGSVKRFMRPD